jgi:tetratricopeptide (TPR) repeat protein
MYAAALGVCLLHAGPLVAGLYNTAEPSVGPTASFGQFRGALNDLRSIAVEQPEGPLRRHYLARVAELEAKERGVGLTVDERVNLSAYLIRLMRPPRAIEVLTPVATPDRGNFLVFANLATAYQLTDQWDRAVDALRQALKVWPSLWPGLSTAQLDWYRRAETYHLKLLLHRRRLALAQGRGGSPALSLDPLFIEGRFFVGDSGRYEPGELAAAQRAELPPDALSLVQQLLLWLPHDSGLFWLLGELLNAQGEVVDAAAVLEELVFSRRVDAPDLRRHRQVLNEAQAVAKQLRPLLRDGQMLWWLAPRGEGLATPAAGPLLTEAGWVGALREAKRLEEGGGFEMSRVAAAADAPPPAGPATVDWLPGLAQVAVVSSLTTMVVAALVYLQIRELRRRRHGAVTAPKG